MPSIRSSSLTATAVPPVSRMALRISVSANGPGTRSPLATVHASGHSAMRDSPRSKARTTGAQPVDCTAISLGVGPSTQPSALSSSNAFHMPTRPVPPPVG